MPWRKVFSLGGRGCPDPKNIRRIIGISSTNVVAEYISSETNSSLQLLDQSGNSRHLAASGTPTIGTSNIVSDGNTLRTYVYNGTTQYHSIADADWQDIWTSDFSVSMLCAPTVASKGIFGKSVVDTSGIRINTNASGYAECILYASTAAPTSLTVTGPSISIIDTHMHLINIVRASNILTVWTDGQKGACTSCSGYGLAGGGTFVIGLNNTTYMTGNLIYARFINRAMTDIECIKEFQLCNGIYSGSQGIDWLMDAPARSGGSNNSQQYKQLPNRKIVLMPATWFRTGRGEGRSLVVEGTATNLFTYSNTFTNAAWTVSGASITATSNILPDGTAGTTNCFHEDSSTGLHTLTRTTQFSATSGTSYVFSMKIRYNPSASTPRKWHKMELTDGTKYIRVWFNTYNGTIGTVSRNFTTSGYWIEPAYDGWYRCWLSATAENTATGSTTLYAADADNSDSFAGANQDSYFIAYGQLETGNKPSSYIPTTSGAATRANEYLSIIPYRLRNSLSNVLTTSPTMYINFNQEPSGTTILSNDGGSTWTKQGNPRHYKTIANGHYHLFDGTNDYYTIDHAGATAANLYTSGNFSIVGVFTPSSISGTRVIYSSIDGSNRGISIYQSSTKIVFEVFNGSTSSTLTSTPAMTAGEPVLFTATYTRGISTDDSTSVIYINNFSATSSAAQKLLVSGTSGIAIGATPAGANKINYKLNYIALYNGTVLTQTDHNNLYSALKQNGILPTIFSSTSFYTKLRIKFKYRFVQSFIPSSANIWEISGGYDANGAVQSTRDRITFVLTAGTSPTTLSCISYSDVAGTSKTMATSSIDHTKWHEIDCYWDFSNLTNSYLKADGVAGTHALTGTHDINLTAAKIRIGGIYAYYQVYNNGFEFADIELFVDR